VRTILLAAVLLAGCATAPPPLPVEVRIPVPVPCVQAVSERPALAWDALADAGVYDQVRALLIDRGRLVAHVDELQAKHSEAEPQAKVKAK
jgi:hypothetical protein